MDPVSITATVITFVTALKDLVELVQKIHDSVSNNCRSAQRAADNIKDMIVDINAVYKSHEEALANMDEFDLALKDLLRKFRGFEASILPLIPPKRRFSLSISFFRGWWNNNKVKGIILELEADVRQVKRRFMMQHAMRTEVKLEAIHQDAIRGLETLRIVRKDVYDLRRTTRATVPTRMSESFGTGNEIEQNVVLLAQSSISTSVPLTRAPTALTDKVMTTAFIQYQINCIAKEVEHVSALSPSGPVIPRSERLSFTVHGSSTFRIGNDAVRAAMNIRDCLSDPTRVDATQVAQAASTLGHVSNALMQMGMTSESILVCDLEIALNRALVANSGSHHDRVALALALCNQSSNYERLGDARSRQIAAEEAFSVTQTLLNERSEDSDVQAAYGLVLIRYGSLAPDNDAAIMMCAEAVLFYENLLDVQPVTDAVLNLGTIERLPKPSSRFSGDLVHRSPPLHLVIAYSEALAQLAICLARDGRSQSAQHCAMFSIAICRELVAGDPHKFKPVLAASLWRLCRNGAAKSFPKTEHLALVDEGVQLLRELTAQNPFYFAQALAWQLEERAKTLESLGQVVEAIATRQEQINLIADTVQDHRLHSSSLFILGDRLVKAKRFNEAAERISQSIAVFPDTPRSKDFGTFVTMACCFLFACRYREAADAAQKSVTMCQNACLKGSAGRGELAAVFSVLAASLVALGNYSEGVRAWQEASRLMDQVLTADAREATSDVMIAIDSEIYRKHVSIGFLLKEKALSTRICSTAAKQLEHLVSSAQAHNRNAIEQLISVQLTCAHNLYRLGYLHDALEYIGQWRGNWDTRRTDPEWKSDTLDWVEILMLSIETKALEAQGYAEDALQRIWSHPTSAVMIHAQEVFLEVKLGKSEKALNFAERILEIERSFLPKNRWRTTWSLFGVAHAALSCGDYPRAIESAQEGINLMVRQHWLEDDILVDDFTATTRPIFFAIMSSAEANTGRLSHALDYAQQAVACSLDLAVLKHRKFSALALHSHIETRGYLAEVLLASGDLVGARDICNDRRAYFRDRVADRMGEFWDLAPTLRMLGVLCCHEGLHEEGEAAARELTDIINRLGVVFPSLQEQVKIRLRYQASVPILKALDEMTEKLECDHQKGISALFKD